MRKLFLSVLLIAVTSYIFSQLPTSFDLRDYEEENYVTTVKSQQEGTCWTHGSMAAIESNMYMTGAWEDAGETGEPALAEYHLDWWNGFNKHNNDDLETQGSGLVVHEGGDYRVTTAYLSRLEGAVRDIDGQSFDTPPLRTSESYHYFYPRHVEWYTAGEDLEYIETIKTKIMQYGVMATCICWDYDFVDYSYNFYQPSSSTMLPNHSVSIIGWDDDHVVPAAPGNGAWLVKNSWGSGWGNSGYFWISYHDKWSCQEPEMGAVSFYDVEPLQYTNVYYHDYHGWRDTYVGIESAFNAFEAKEDSWLKSVNFFTAQDTVEYIIKVYDNFTDNQLTDILSITTGSFDHTGLHTVDLAIPARLQDGDDFYIYLELSDGGQPYDRTSDVPVLLGGESKTIVESAAEEGQSFYFSSCCGWADLYFYDDPSGYQNTGNFCVKGLSEGSTPETFGSIFVIRNGSKGEPIQNAQVDFNETFVLTNLHGEAQFAGIAPTNDMEYSVSADGYEPQTGTINIENDVVVLDIDMTPIINIESFANIGVTVYPNPSSGIINIANTENIKNSEIIITDISGKEIYRTSVDNQTSVTIDLTAHANGIYFIKIETNDKIYTQRWVKE